MSKIIQIQDINSSDTLKTMVEKINYNFDQIMAFGGGPKGEMGLRGFIGPDGEQGEQGERGNLITVVDNISTVGDNLKAGDLAIYSDNEYIYKVEEIDGEKHFVSTNICIKGDVGESGSSASPFGYSGDAIITNKKGTSAPKYTFIGTDTTIGGNIGNLNVVGSDGIHIFTPTDDNVSDNGYCGKIYGELGSENILVLQGEDKPNNNYVKIDDTLLTNKIHSSDNSIKIAEIINGGVVLGDKSKNTSIECNELTVKNGSKTPIKTSSSRIDLKGSLYVNYEDYNYTTNIYGTSIDINTHDSSLCVSTCIQANKDGATLSYTYSDKNSNTSAYVKNNKDGAIMSHVDSKKSTCIQANKDNGVVIEHKDLDSLCVSTISISIEDGIKIDANKVIIGSNTQIKGNTTVGGYATAKVDGVPDVYLGCPIGTIVMWAGSTTPDGWLLCNGEYVCLGNDGSVIHQEGYDNGVWYGTKYQNLINKIGSTYGISGNQYGTHYKLPDLRQKFPLGYNNITRYQQISNVFNSYTDWEYTILSNLVDVSNGEFKKINGMKEIPTKMRNTQKLLIERLSDFYGISITSTSYEPMITEINNTTIFGLGSISGELMHTLTVDEMPKHNHMLFAQGAQIITSGSGGEKLEYSTTRGYSTAQEGEDNAHNNIPPYLALNFIIKYK